MLSSIKSFGLQGIDSYLVTVEADLSRGMPAFEVVGLPDAAVRESRDRIRAAIRNSGLSFPASRIVVNLAPADTKKAGSVYDLPILLSILKADGQLSASLDRTATIGEISLGGELRPVAGVLPMILDAASLGLDEIIIPFDNAAEGAVVEGCAVYPAKTVEEVLLHLSGRQRLNPAKAYPLLPEAAVLLPDLSDVRGQQEAKRALCVAAAGMHNILFIGSPGSGKSMLAQRLPTILPELDPREQIETTKLHSVAGFLPSGVGLVKRRPFRSPHHSVSAVSLIGGGSNPRPGEVSLAHNGVLFLDELPEFSRQAMEGLRQPIEDGRVTISRAGGRVTFPSSFMLVAAMNPCPCGFFGHPTKRCTCTPGAISRYLSHVSGPLLDRIDIHLEVPPVDYESLAGKQAGESSASVRERVGQARALQRARFEGVPVSSNAAIPRSLLGALCPMTSAAQKLLKLAFDRLGLSARGYDRIVRVARTCADLEGSEIIDSAHISEAIQYRTLDRKYWNR